MTRQLNSSSAKISYWLIHTQLQNIALKAMPLQPCAKSEEFWHWTQRTSVTDWWVSICLRGHQCPRCGVDVRSFCLQKVLLDEVLIIRHWCGALPVFAWQMKQGKLASPVCLLLDNIKLYLTCSNYHTKNVQVRILKKRVSAYHMIRVLSRWANRLQKENTWLWRNHCKVWAFQMDEP